MVSRFVNQGAATGAPATQATTTRQAAPARAAGKSKYDGVSMAGGDGPPPLWPAFHPEGAYVVELNETVDDFGQGSDDSSFKAYATIVDIDPENADANAHHKVGDQVYLHVGMTSGKGQKPGLQRCKRFVVLAAGYTEEAEFMSELGNAFVDGAGRNENLVGRKLAVNSKRGADSAKARYGFYVEYDYFVADDKILGSK